MEKINARSDEHNGIAFLFSETGTEGGWWAMQEDGFLDEDGVHWKYEGLRELEEGDDFTVFAKDGSVLWHGIIHKDEKTGMRCHRVLRGGKWVVDRSWKQQVVGGFWVHWVQAGMDPEAWGKLFMGKKRCLLKRKSEAPSGLSECDSLLVSNLLESAPAPNAKLRAAIAAMPKPAI